MLAKDFHVAILGAGIAGCSIALRFAELGIRCSLIEKGEYLVNGPPICHLHAGGNLYREISDQQCLSLLKQSIDTVKAYPQCVNHRPTVIALPKNDKGKPADLLNRLNKLQQRYAELIEEDASNEVLGKADGYYQIFERKDLEALCLLDNLAQPKTASEWMRPVAKQLDFSQLQFPLLVVQEYGLSAFRFSAISSLALEQLESCEVLTSAEVLAVKPIADDRWQLSLRDQDIDCDFVINACGFRSGVIDDMLAKPRKRMVEFKAAYVAKWQEAQQGKANSPWPEVIFYGDRGTPQGMAQLTPYPQGYYQLHGMTKDITLFKNGLVGSDAHSAQPQLDKGFIEKINHQWPKEVMQQRSDAAIEHMAQFIPQFSTATMAAAPLYGAQQIPGEDPDLRASDVSFAGKNYARTEIVKASSAIAAADEILKQLQLHHGLHLEQPLQTHFFPVTQALNPNRVNKLAEEIAIQRNYPGALAQVF